MKNNNKKHYLKPELKVHGNVKKMTEGGGVSGGDALMLRNG